MLIHHLAFLVALAEEKHFGKAARACKVAQPTLSAALRKLEEDLSTILIVRGHRFLGFTPDGERVLEWSRQILRDYDSLRKDLGGTQKGLCGNLRLGVVPAALPLVAMVTDQFHRRHPNVTVRIVSMTSRAIQHGLDTFEIDGGLTYLENEPLQNVLRIPLYHEKYAFACQQDHPSAAREAITWKEAVGQPLCILSTDMQNRRIIDHVVESIGLTIHAPIVANSFLAIYSHLRAGRWCSIVPHTFFSIFGDAQKLAAIRLIDPVHSQSVGLVFSSREPRSPMTSALARVFSRAGFDAGAPLEPSV